MPPNALNFHVIKIRKLLIDVYAISNLCFRSLKALLYFQSVLGKHLEKIEAL